MPLDSVCSDTASAGRGHRNRVVALARLLTLAAVFAALLAALGSSPALGGAPQKLNVAVEPSARAGQPQVRAGRAATLGPQAFHPSSAAGVRLDVVNALRDGSPIFNGDFADPFALKTSHALYLFATSTRGSKYAPAAHIPEIELTQQSDFAGYYLGDALPQLPTWTVSGFQWAPSVWARADGTYVMYYSTPAIHPQACLADPKTTYCVHGKEGPTDAMCISAATSSSPSGPYVDKSSAPFICPFKEGGAIDPSIFIDRGHTPWLLWKSDGDCCGLPTAIYAQQLTPDGLGVAGAAHRLIGASQSWEGGLVEGPAMVESAGRYWLFYSANEWGTDRYGIGIAQCRSVSGPCTKPLQHAWLASSDSSQIDPGPGGEEFFDAGGLVWMVHHGLAPGQSGDLAQRRLYVDLLVFPKGRLPRVANGNAAAALAEGELYNNDPDLPTRPTAAYIRVLKDMSGAFGRDLDKAVVADGQTSCRDLGRHDNVEAVLRSLRQADLDSFEAYLVAIFATKYFCPEYVSQALTDVRQSLVNDS